MRIDLNADLGEGFGPYTIADDETLMGIITSANVACGYHAGDPVVMDRTIRLARAHGVDLGAHAGYPDRMGFGRRHMDMPLDELEKHILYQIGALAGLARAAGHVITHFTPHGALGNLAIADARVAETVVKAVAAFDPDIAFRVMSGTALEAAARTAGRRTINVFLADRAYTNEGQLVSRALPGAVIKDLARIAARVRRVLRDGTIETIDGQSLAIDVQSILIHSDTAGAVAIGTAIRAAIEAEGGAVLPIFHG